MLKNFIVENRELVTLSILFIIPVLIFIFIFNNSFFYRNYFGGFNGFFLFITLLFTVGIYIVFVIKSFQYIGKKTVYFSARNKLFIDLCNIILLFSLFLIFEYIHLFYNRIYFQNFYKVIKNIYYQNLSILFYFLALATFIIFCLVIFVNVCFFINKFLTKYYPEKTVTVKFMRFYKRIENTVTDYIIGSSIIRDINDYPAKIYSRWPDMRGSVTTYKGNGHENLNADKPVIFNNKDEFRFDSLSCPKCDSQININDKFCPKCGMKFD